MTVQDMEILITSAALNSHFASRTNATPGVKLLLTYIGTDSNMIFMFSLVSVSFDLPSLCEGDPFH